MLSGSKTNFFFQISGVRMGVGAYMDATLLTNLLNYCPLFKPNTW